MMESPTILITGGAGFIGSHIVEHYQGKAGEIRVLDNLRTGYLQNLEGLEHTFIQGSITDKDLVKKAIQGVDYIFHMAAIASVSESMEKASECLAINTQGLLNISTEAAASGVKKIIFASSAALYGDTPILPKVETMPPAPQSPYAHTKLDGEHYLEALHAEGNINTTSMRLFNVFGPRQDPKGSYAAAIPIFIEKALRGDPITIYGDGEQTRDFIYVKDIVEALAYAAHNHEMHGIYNASYGEQITINQLAQQILKTTNSTSVIRHTEERTSDIRHSRASIEKLLTTGWKPRYNLQDGITATTTYFKNKIAAK